jgi:hypothetical protein
MSEKFLVVTNLILNYSGPDQSTAQALTAAARRSSKTIIESVYAGAHGEYNIFFELFVGNIL